MDRARTDAAAGSPPSGWVTVAQAAAALTDSGDAIDASNVSRYLARFQDIPQERRGKFRFVDLAVLKRHRATNVLVGEKQAYRAADVSVPEANAVRVPRPAVEDLDEDEGGTDIVLGPVAQANLRIKHLKIREIELDIAEREGALIPDHEVLALVSGVMAVFVSALEREEVAIAAAHGREVATAYRKARKAAQAKAAAKLVELARKSMPDQLAAKVEGEAA